MISAPAKVTQLDGRIVAEARARAIQYTRLTAHLPPTAPPDPVMLAAFSEPLAAPGQQPATRLATQTTTDRLMRHKIDSHDLRWRAHQLTN